MDSISFEGYRNSIQTDIKSVQENLDALKENEQKYREQMSREGIPPCRIDSLIAENYQKYNKQLEYLARELEDSYLDEILAGAFEEYER